MPKPRKTPLSPRKVPRQARSAQLVEAVLEAAARVLAREGARRFTTVRVAEEAGVSVGSLYQYFPNKEALLFRLQADEWRDTSDLLFEILGDRRDPPLVRLRRAIRTFFRSEQQEAALRRALEEASALYRDAPESRAHRADVHERTRGFIDEVLPRATAKERDFAVEVTLEVMGTMGKHVSEQGFSRAKCDAWAEVVADMCCGHLERLGAR